MIIPLFDLWENYDSVLKEKILKLRDFFARNPKTALAFSGGVDSSFLLYAGTSLNADIKPYYVKSAFQPEFEHEDALDTSSLLGVKTTVLYTDVLSSREVTQNPSNRCYYCKKAIFGMLMEKALTDGYDTIIDGTNAGDDETVRPGMAALKEFSVISPLRETGFVKNEIRQILKDAGMPIWEKPAYSCLATRVTVGETITADLLSRIEKAEGMLFSLGFTDFRVRVSRNKAKLQFVESEIKKAYDNKELIISKLSPFFGYINENFEIRKSHG